MSWKSVQNAYTLHGQWPLSSLTELSLWGRHTLAHDSDYHLIPEAIRFFHKALVRRLKEALTSDLLNADFRANNHVCISNFTAHCPLSFWTFERDVLHRIIEIIWGWSEVLSLNRCRSAISILIRKVLLGISRRGKRRLLKMVSWIWSQRARN